MNSYKNASKKISFSSKNNIECPKKLKLNKTKKNIELTKISKPPSTMDLFLEKEEPVNR